jgi:hypothetical protein
VAQADGPMPAHEAQQQRATNHKPSWKLSVVSRKADDHHAAVRIWIATVAGPVDRGASICAWRTRGQSGPLAFRATTGRAAAAARGGARSLHDCTLFPPTRRRSASLHDDPASSA